MASREIRWRLWMPGRGASKLESRRRLPGFWNTRAANNYATSGPMRHICVVGGLVSIGGVSRSYAAALNPETGRAYPWDPKPDRPILGLAATADTVFAVGLFENIGGQPRKNIAALDAVTGQALPWSLDLPNPFKLPGSGILSHWQFRAASFRRGQSDCCQAGAEKRAGC